MFDAKALKEIVEKGAVRYKESSSSYIFDCPHCSKKEKLYIHKQKGIFICFYCAHIDGFKGKCEWALRELYDISLDDIRNKLYNLGNSSENLPGALFLQFDDIWEDLDQEEIEIESLPTPVCWPPEFCGPESHLFRKGEEYLTSRGITRNHIDTYQIKFCPKERRVIFPVIIDGNLIGWQARYIGKTTEINPITGYKREIPKILSSKSLSGNNKYLMFQDRLKTSKHCVLAEGPVSAIKADLCGGNVASRGKAVSRQQLQIIKSYTNKLYLAIDPDAAEEISRIVRDYSNDFTIYLLEPPKGREDLGDATPEEVYEQFKSAPLITRSALFLSLGNKLLY